ncbi:MULTISPECIES: hypothetical protein [unclassified Yoonia]|uniref:hypothetical protein n=1 Tax=unclassified Yoonia TaxID=2629118 RepID=UPI002AFE6DB9|nr:MULTISPECIES: hypothetical protein [unclassified Yoonia]
MKTGVLILAGALVLAACAPQQFDRPRGVGFDDRSAFEIERAQREAALAGGGGGFAPPPTVQSAPIGPVGGAIPASELAAAGIGQGGFGSGFPAPGANLPPQPAMTTTPPAPVRSNTGISDEQNFDAVAGRETIESDAQRRQAAIAAQQQIAPQPLPERPVATGPNIVEYALNAPNVRGQEWYSRSLLSGQARFQRNCAAYATADDAQRDFLARGGPERDRLGIDPDGDGFACGWDPEPFRRAVQN